jgi:hypothetical protein
MIIVGRSGLGLDRGWKVVWTPPYYPKFQTFELVWWAGALRMGQLNRPHRPSADLRIELYGGEGRGINVHELLEVAGCWDSAKGEISEWIAKDKHFEMGGLSGDQNQLVGMEHWTTAADCLDIKNMGNIATVEAGDLEFEDACSDYNSDFD